VLLLGGGVALLLVAARLVAAAFDCGFSPFAYLDLPEGYGWQAVIFGGLVAACVALLALAGGTPRDELWLAGPRGGVLMSGPAVEEMLSDQAREHPDVVRASADVRVRRGRPKGVLNLELRPLADRDALGPELGAVARASLVRLSGVDDAEVKVRARVLNVRQLPGRLS